MADSTPNDSGPVVPDPHQGEPLPAPQEGMRPEADPSVVRPEDDEPTGPIAGLMAATAAEAKEEATPGDDDEAEALLAQMGVEEEGIESGQILGVVIAILASIAALVIVMYFLFYVPFRQETFAAAGDQDDHPELTQVRTEALDKLSGYRLIDETSYAIPIGRAMGLVAASYGTGDPAEVAAVPTTRQRFNELMVPHGWGRSVQRPAQMPALQTVNDPAAEAAGATPGVEPRTGEEVGVDEPFEADTEINNE